MDGNNLHYLGKISEQNSLSLNNVKSIDIKLDDINNDNLKS